MATARGTRRRGSPRISGIALEGPFFEADLTATLLDNAHAFVKRIAEVGEAEARSRAAQAPRKFAGPTYAGGFIRGRTVSLGGRRWSTTAVISADTSGVDQARARRIQATLAGRHNRIDRDGNDIGKTAGHEGTAKVFSGTARSLRRFIKDIDLSKGLG